MEYGEGRTSMYLLIDIDMLKAYDDCEMSKSMYIKNKNMIITASRGRKIKVRNKLFSSGKYHPLGGMHCQLCRKSDKSKSAGKLKICIK